MTKGLILTVSFPGRQPAGQTEIYCRENVIKNDVNRPFPSSPGPLYQNEVKCSAYDKEMIFHSHANKTHFHKKGSAIGLFLKVRVYGTRKRPITLDKVWKKSLKWYRRPFMAIFKDFHSGSKKSIHDCTITLSFSLYPWFTTLNNTSSLFKSVAYKLLPTPGHHQHVKIADHNYYYVTDTVNSENKALQM